MKTIYFFSMVTFLFSFSFSYSQCTSPLNFALQKNLGSSTPLLNHDLTARRDSSVSKPYLYVAGKERGLMIYNISNVSSAVLTNSILPSSLNNLHVMSLTQAGNYLYLALGDHFNASSQNSGLAIIDITVPTTPVIKSVYSYTASSGAGFVAVEGNYAYLAAMQNGILVFDVTNKSSIQLMSQFIPNQNFPVNNPSASDKLKINARSMVIKNDIMYLCYDAGGVRIINTTNKTSLKENGKYSNPLLNARPRAYNNLVLNDTLVYVAADYCGMEVLNVKDTAHISSVGWWNPWKCETSANTWFNSPGHTNEIEFDPTCKTVFMSAGRSDLMAVSVANPVHPDSCSQYGSKTDSIGTWGLGHYQGQIYLAYLSTWPLFVPFRSEWSGVKILTYNNACFTEIKEPKLENTIVLYPNPVKEELTFNNPFLTKAELLIFDSKGSLVYKRNYDSAEPIIHLKVKSYADGIYFIRLSDGIKQYNTKFVVSNE